VLFFTFLCLVLVWKRHVLYKISNRGGMCVIRGGMYVIRGGMYVIRGGIINVGGGEMCVVLCCVVLFYIIGLFFLL
jgi:hypothetical protein